MTSLTDMSSLTNMTSGAHKSLFSTPAYVWSELTPSARADALTRPAALSDAMLIERVKTIMTDVKTRGDSALLEYTRQYDAPTIGTLQIDKAEMAAAWTALPDRDKAALEQAKANITAFHTAQKPQVIEVETMTGVICRREPRALESAGLYVPGGTAPLVSTLLMLAIPAQIAGVTHRIVLTPPSKIETKDNSSVNPAALIHPAILAAAYLCDVTALFACGGAQAIAALTYGTSSVPKCDKIFGPGNAYVATAKSLAAQEAGGPAIDLPAGPSEAMVIADETCNPAFVASDLLSQAEHDPLAQVICVATSETIIHAIQDEIRIQITTLPRREIAQNSLAQARFFIAETRADMIDIANIYAPEHLIIQTENPQGFVRHIRNAGSIFLGQWTPESVGDYASGTNHTLPTNGAARAYSGVTLESFIKYISIQSLTRAGLEALGPTVERLAELEGLDAHKRAVSLRLKTLAPKRLPVESLNS